MPNPSPAPLAAFLRELAGNSKWLTWDAEFTSDELAAKILAHLGAAPRAPSAAAIEGLAAEWYEESYGQGWHDATKDEQRDFRARAKTQLDAAYAIDRPALPAAPSPAGPWVVETQDGGYFVARRDGETAPQLGM